MILYENQSVRLRRNLSSSEAEEDSSSEGTESEDEENELEKRNHLFFLLQNLGLNYQHILTHLNLNINLPNINLRNTSLWRIYENGVENLSKIQTGLMTNLGRPEEFSLDISDSLDLEDDLRNIFISREIHNKGIEDPRDKFYLEPRFLEVPPSPPRTHSVSYGDAAKPPTKEFNEEGKPEDDEPVLLSEEFWTSIVTATTEGCPDSAVCLPVPGTQATVKAPLNPFFHRSGTTFFQALKIGVGTLLFPVRICLILVFLSLAWFFSSISTSYLSAEELRSKPLAGWRKMLKLMTGNIVMRILFFCAGFYWVKTRGRQATRAEAPILVVAPHSTYFDAFPLILMGAPSIVAKSSVAKVPFFGQLVDMTQALYVTREVKTSRSETLNMIKTRATSELDWSQIYIYPEGTCTNRSCLVSFKLGAFYAGVPVQPVIIKYPNSYDSVTWTFDGGAWWEVLYRTLTQFVLYCEVEFLPVHKPTAEEIKDPALYANNVRQEMAGAMGVPVSDYSYEDGITMTQMNTDHLLGKLKQIARLRNSLKLSSLVELNVVRSLSSSGRNPWWVGKGTFVDLLSLQEADAGIVDELCQVFIHKEDGLDSVMDIREYFVFACLLNHSIRVDKIMPVIFLMYAEGQRRMSEERFLRLMQCVFEMSEENAREFFRRGRGENVDAPIDLDELSKKLKKRLEYVRLYALQANDLLRIYPPRSRELNPYKHHLKKQE